MRKNWLYLKTWNWNSKFFFPKQCQPMPSISAMYRRQENSPDFYLYSDGGTLLLQQVRPAQSVNDKHGIMSVASVLYTIVPGRTLYCIVVTHRRRKTVWRDRRNATSLISGSINDWKKKKIDNITIMNTIIIIVKSHCCCLLYDGPNESLCYDYITNANTTGGYRVPVTGVKK